MVWSCLYVLDSLEDLYCQGLLQVQGNHVTLIVQGEAVQGYL